MNLSSETVVRKTREIEDLANRIYGIKDGAYWMNRVRELEKLLKEVSDFCSAGYKYEIEKALGMVH